MIEPLVTLNNISYQRGKKCILQAVNMSICRGEIVALIGENGSGKTTLLSIVAGLLNTHKGERQYATPSPKVAWVGDKPAVYPDWNVDVFLHWCAEAQGAKDPDTIAQEMATLCALNPVLKQPCKTLSHGYRQRVSLARALTAQPKLLLLDEPGNGLDYTQKLALRDILRRIREHAGILMVNHDITEVIATADRVYDIRHTHCLPINLPDKENWLWCQWKNETLAQTQNDADKIIGCCSGYLCRTAEQRQEKMAQISHQFTNIEQLTTTYPLIAFQAHRETIWA